MNDVSPPSPSLLKALSDADWPQILPRLAAYAERRLRRVGWAHGKDEEPGRMSVTQAVNTALERCLEGRRRWNDDDPPDLLAFLCGVIRSVVSDEKKMASRDKAHLDPEAVDTAADPKTEEGVIDGVDADRSAVCDAVEACAKGDDALESFYLSVLDGNTKREAIAEDLGWTAEAVTAARNKLQRRLLKQFPNEFASAKRRRSS